MKEKEIHQAIVDGTLREKLSKHNRASFLPFVLLCLCWIGHAGFNHMEKQNLRDENHNLKRQHIVDSLTISIVNAANDSAVYFNEIKLRNK